MKKIIADSLRLLSEKIDPNPATPNDKEHTLGILFPFYKDSYDREIEMKNSFYEKTRYALTFFSSVIFAIFFLLEKFGLNGADFQNLFNWEYMKSTSFGPHFLLFLSFYFMVQSIRQIINLHSDTNYKLLPSLFKIRDVEEKRNNMNYPIDRYLIVQLITATDFNRSTNQRRLSYLYRLQLNLSFCVFMFFLFAFLLLFIKTLPSILVVQ